MSSNEREPKPIHGHFQIPTPKGIIDIEINSGQVFQGAELLKSFAYGSLTPPPTVEIALDTLQKATQNLKPNATAPILKERRRIDALFRSEWPRLARLVPSEILLTGEIADTARALRRAGIKKEEELADLDITTCVKLFGSKRFKKGIEIVSALSTLAIFAQSQQDQKV